MIDKARKSPQNLSNNHIDADEYPCMQQAREVEGELFNVPIIHTALNDITNTAGSLACADVVGGRKWKRLERENNEVNMLCDEVALSKRPLPSSDCSVVPRKEWCHSMIRRIPLLWRRLVTSPANTTEYYVGIVEGLGILRQNKSLEI